MGPLVGVCKGKPERRMKGNLWRVCFGLGLYISVCLSCAGRPKIADPRGSELEARLRPGILSAMKRGGIPGMSIAVYSPEQGSWTAGYGNTAGFAARQVRPDTLFCLGSISKSFTAAAILSLARQGKLDLDAPYQDYVPEFSLLSRFPGAQPITARLLLTHTSGLPVDMLADKFSGKKWEYRKVISYFKDQYFLSPPGERVNYCNMGYSLLGILIERLSGRDFYDFERDEILRPLGMIHSDFDKSKTPASLRSKGQLPGWALDEPTVYDAPAGSLWSSAADMLEFFRSLDKAWQSSSAEGPFCGADQGLMRKASTPALSFDKGSGLGVWPDPLAWGAQAPVLSHGGGTLAFSTLYVWLPEERIGVAVLCNKMTSYKEELARQVITQIRSQGAGRAGPHKAPETLPPFQALPPGSYRFGFMDGIVSLSEKDGAWSWEKQGSFSAGGRLEWEADTALLKLESGVVYDRARFSLASGRWAWIRLGPSGSELRGMILEREGAMADWADIAGKWEITNAKGIKGIPLPPGRPEVAIDLGKGLFTVTMLPALFNGFSSIKSNFIPLNPEQALKIGVTDRDSGATLFRFRDGKGDLLRFADLELRRKKK